MFADVLNGFAPQNQFTSNGKVVSNVDGTAYHDFDVSQNQFNINSNQFHHNDFEDEVNIVNYDGFPSYSDMCTNQIMINDNVDFVSGSFDKFKNSFGN